MITRKSEFVSPSLCLTKSAIKASSILTNIASFHCPKVRKKFTVLFLLYTSSIIVLLDGYEITEALYAEYEAKKHSEPVQFSPGDSVFVKAAAWKTSFYRLKWPYDDVEISSAYFEARVDALIKGGTKFQLSFCAFEMDAGRSEFSR